MHLGHSLLHGRCFRPSLRQSLAVLYHHLPQNIYHNPFTATSRRSPMPCSQLSAHLFPFPSHPLTSVSPHRTSPSPHLQHLLHPLPQTPPMQAPHHRPILPLRITHNSPIQYPFSPTQPPCLFASLRHLLRHLLPCFRYTCSKLTTIPQPRIHPPHMMKQFSTPTLHETFTNCLSSHNLLGVSAPILYYPSTWEQSKRCIML